MSAPTLGITILIVFAFITVSNLLFQGLEHRKRHKELLARLEKIESYLNR